MALGLIADAFGGVEAGFWLTAMAMIISGLWVAVAAEETLARKNPRPE